LNKRIKHSDLLKSEWDILIIIDACRYDKFKKVLKETIKHGELQCGNSQASSTIAWLNKHWVKDDGTYHADIIYVSGNPFVNSKGISFNKYKNLDFRSYFGEIIDAWDFAFDKETDRIEPDLIALRAADDFASNPNCRFIIHFMQPHAPYLFTKRKFEIITFLKRHISMIHLFKLRKHIPKFFKKKKMHMMEYNYSKKYTNKEIIKAYEDNLRSIEPVLLWLIKDILNGKKIVITSDHGEYLGEKGRYGHGGKQNRLITSVPVLCIGC
jgi:hypothetical protein